MWSAKSPEAGGRPHLRLEVMFRSGPARVPGYLSEGTVLEQSSCGKPPPPLISPGQGCRWPHGFQPAALALWIGKNEAARPQSPQLPAVLPEHQPDPEEKEKKTPR